ncbi:type VI secretion system Vgr family protein [Caballeronia sp. RCC_10]|uniref:type VI secretion system Vgr family protein n=1 Tax=Caballeronia sp. RCC_10 TaxID=3239227 RepID=UPI0035237FBD
MAWSAETHTITFKSPALPEIVGRGYGGEELREPMLTVRSIRGREAVGELFEYTVLAQVERPDFLRNPSDAAQVDLEEIVGTNGTVAIEVTGIGTFRAGQQGATGSANLGADTRYISGRIVSARIICTEDRAAVYEFVLRPSVWTATQNKNSRIFSGDVTDVLQKLLGRYGVIDWRIAGPTGGKKHYPPRDFIRQAWESDWNLALRLMEEWGLFFWFEHDKKGHTLVVSDTLGGFHPHGVAYETLRYHTGGRIDEEHISELSLTYTLTAGKATVNDHDYMKPRLRKSNAGLREEYEDTNGTAKRGIEIYAPAEFAQPEADNSPANDAREEGRHLARVKLQAARCMGLRAHGKGHLRGLQPGRSFTLAGYPQTKANRDYVVLMCELEMTEVGTSSGSWRQYAVNTTFELQPDTEYYRLPQVTPRPHVDDEYAVIVAPEHHPNQHYETWIDDKNRVRIQYDWDREARYDGATSIWVRVASQWQGGQMGVVAPGRAGQMVIVSHVHGDPDRPYVSGFVVDRWNMPPWELPRNDALIGIRSQSLGESMASNHVVLDDTYGQMQAQLASDHAKSSLTLGFNTRIDGNKGRQEARGEGFELRTDAHGVARAAKGLLVTTEARSNAQNHALDMGETIARLTQARDLHESLSESAQRHGAQDATHNQNDATLAIKSANDEIRGTGKGSPYSGGYPEFAAPHLTLASAAGIQTTAAGSTHIASNQHFAVTSGRNVSIAAAGSMFASVVNTFSLFVHKAGMRLVAAAGKIRLEAQSDGVEIVARKDADIVSADGWINLTAAKGIRLNGGGSVVEISLSGLRGFTGGEFLVHAASHGTDVPQARPVRLPVLPEQPGILAAHHVLIEHDTGFVLPNQPYRITVDDGRVLEGVSNALGETEIVTSNEVALATVELFAASEPDRVIAVNQSIIARDVDRKINVAAPNPNVKSADVGGKKASAPAQVATSEGQPPLFASCDPMNFGLRSYHFIKDAKQEDSSMPIRRDVEYPVTKTYTAAIKKKLKGIDWAELKSPDGQISRELKNAIEVAVKATLSIALKEGPFGMPRDAMPEVQVPDFETAVKRYYMRPDVSASFVSRVWVIAIHEKEIAKIIAASADPIQLDSQLKSSADMLYHEARHCQQVFWMITLLRQHQVDYASLSQIGRVFKDITPEPIFEKANSVSIPNDDRVVKGLHKMLVFYYYWTISFMQENGGADLESDVAIAQAQVCKLLNVSTETAAKMVTFEQGYRSQLHEEDAYACAEVVQAYWDYPDRALVRNPGTCTDAYLNAVTNIGARG